MWRRDEPTRGVRSLLGPAQQLSLPGVFYDPGVWACSYAPPVMVVFVVTLIYVTLIFSPARNFALAV